MNLTTSQGNHEWLRNLMTVDEKLVLYINYAHGRQWLSAGETGEAIPKTELHP